MTTEQMIYEGLYLMLLGMGVVITFLSLLVLLLTLMKKLIGDAIDETVHEPAIVVESSKNDAVLTAVITSAIHQHRK